MKKILQQIRINWLTNLITLLVSLTIGGGIFCLYFFLRDRAFIDAVNGSAIAAMVIILSGALCFLAYLGAFDTFAFGFKQLGSMMFDRDARRDGKFSDYKAEKKEKRDHSSYYFISIILAGLLLLIAVIVLEILYHVKY